MHACSKGCYMTYMRCLATDLEALRSKWMMGGRQVNVDRISNTAELPFLIQGSLKPSSGQCCREVGNGALRAPGESLRSGVLFSSLGPQAPSAFVWLGCRSSQEPEALRKGNPPCDTKKVGEAPSIFHSLSALFLLVPGHRPSCEKCTIK